MKHRFFIMVVSATDAPAAAARIEDEGHEVLSLTPSIVPDPHNGRAMLQVYHIATRIERDAPLTSIEETYATALERSRSRIITPAGNGKIVPFPHR